MTAGEPSPEQVAAILAERLAIAGESLRSQEGAAVASDGLQGPTVLTPEAPTVSSGQGA
jgi:hypothetical protein